MKLFFAVVLLHLLAFQGTDQRYILDGATSTGAPTQDDLANDISMDNDPNTQYLSLGSTEGLADVNGSITATHLASHGDKPDISHNNTASDEGAVPKKPTHFHDGAGGTVIVLMIAAVIAGAFLSPVFNYYCKYYYCKKRAPIDLPPRYQDLLQRDYL